MREIILKQAEKQDIWKQPYFRIMDTNFNKNFTNTIITLWLPVLRVGFVIII